MACLFDNLGKSLPNNKFHFVVDVIIKIIILFAVMQKCFTARRRMRLKARHVKPKFFHLVRSALLARGLHLQDWARAHRISLCQVSLALHGRRVDARSRMIRAELEKLVKGAGR